MGELVSQPVIRQPVLDRDDKSGPTNFTVGTRVKLFWSDRYQVSWGSQEILITVKKFFGNRYQALSIVIK